MPNSNLDIKEGTVTFWVREGKVGWNDNKTYPLLELSSEGNSVFILKDSDNKLKFFHVFLGHGRTDLEYDVSSLSPQADHFVAATWSVTQRRMQLFLDGNLIAQGEISYSV